MNRLLSRAPLLPMLAAALFLSIPWTALAQDVDEHVRTIFVDGANPDAADDNDGSETSPLRTLSQAISVASEANALGIPVRIVVEEGVYRESLELTANQSTTTAQISIEGRGNVVISGSDVLADWASAGEGLYSHHWPHDWGIAPIPEEWPDTIRPYLEANPVIRRREMVFVDHAPFRQVMSREELSQTDDSFYVSEETDELLIHLAAEDLPDGDVEVAMRPLLVVIGSRDNVMIRNITFQHAANAVGSNAAVVVAGSRAVSLLDSRFVHNNGTGLGMSENEDVAIRGVEANHNGVGGITGFQIKDLQVSDTEASFNGWRASRGWDISDHDAVLDPNFIDFGAGQKFFGLRGATFRNYRAIGNLTGGLWLDYDNSEVILTGLVLKRNLTHGLFLEASQGPISLRRSQICDNETGILVGNASDVDVVDNVVANNDLGQVFFAGDPERPVIEHDTGESLSVRTQDWVMRGNYFAVGADSVAVATHLDQSVWFGFVQSLASEANRYSSPSGPDIFQLPGGRRVSLSQWKSETGRDSGSAFVVGEAGCPMPNATPSQGRTTTPLLFIVFLSASIAGMALAILAYRRLQDRWTSA